MSSILFFLIIFVYHLLEYYGQPFDFYESDRHTKISVIESLVSGKGANISVVPNTSTICSPKGLLDISVYKMEVRYNHCHS